MKGMTGKVVAIVVSLIIAFALLVIFLFSYNRVVTFLSQLVSGVISAIKRAFCESLPIIGGLCNAVG